MPAKPQTAVRDPHLHLARRTFLSRTACGIGAAALSSLLKQGTARAGDSSPLATRGAINPLHFAPKAKRVIFLCMRGGPSHLDTFDYKPRLIADAGKL